MKKHIILTLSILALSLNIIAQDAETMLKSAVDKMLAYDNIEMTFDYSMVNTDADINETMEGYAFMQGNAYKLNILGQDIISDGNTTWSYNSDAEEVMISDVDNEEGSGTPIAILKTFYDDITASFIEKDNGGICKIEAHTKAKNENFEKLIVTLNTKSQSFENIQVFDTNGNEFFFTIKKFVTNQTLPADFFTFKAEDYPDAEIIDMR